MLFALSTEVITAGQYGCPVTCTRPPSRPIITATQFTAKKIDQRQIFYGSLAELGYLWSSDVTGWQREEEKQKKITRSAVTITAKQTKRNN